MKQIDGAQIFLLAQMIDDLVIDCQDDKKDGVVIEDKTDQARFKTIFQSLQNRSLPVSVNIADTAWKMMFESSPRLITYDFLRPQLETLKESIFAELRTMLFFRMDEEYRQYFEKPTLFGEAVALKFPSASLDIEEAGKCLALARPTGSVFHAMRVMEVGLKSLAKELKIPYAPSWESYIRQVEANITAKHKSKSKKWKEIEPFFREILGNLISIKIAWRNPTMHIVRNYTPEEAEDIFRSVRTFMQRLSERLSQA